MPPLKDELSPALVARLATSFGGTTGFDAAQFEDAAVDGLDDLELKERISHIAGALSEALPSNTAPLSAAIRRAQASGGLDGWASLPVCEVVATTLLDEPGEALPLLAELTPCFSAEFALRPFLEHHHELTMATLAGWVDHPDEHVRRLVSEGTRPRLPWASVFRPFVADPRPAVALLDRLHDDGAAYVRTSVANHLNDISKDHPELAIEVAGRWQACPHQPSVIRHGLRTLVKQGHPEALSLLGFGPPDGVAAERFVCVPDTISIGDDTEIELTLTTTTPIEALIDFVVHYQGLRGAKAGKVFKWTTRSLTPATPSTLRKTHRFADVSIRRIHPGPHRIEVQVNGVVLAETVVDVRS